MRSNPEDLATIRKLRGRVRVLERTLRTILKILEKAVGHSGNR